MIKDGRASPTRPASPDYPDRQQHHHQQQQQQHQQQHRSMEAGGTRLGQRPPFVHASTSYYHLDTHAGSSNASSSSSPTPVVPSIVVIPYTDSDVEDDEPRRSFAFPPHPRGAEGEKHGAVDPTSSPNGYGRFGRHDTHDNHHHRHAPRLYTHRRVPSGLAETLSARWRSKWACWRDGGGGGGGGGGGEGGLGRALMLGWVGTTLAFLLATALWRGQLFRALDALSKELYDMGYTGQAIFGLLILLTTVPPLPLYSTLMVLSGYTFGVWRGFVVSYVASLSGAILVFVVSRTLLRDVIARSLQSSPTAASLLHIIPANPHLLLLIRVAPYPYNLLNVILASSPALTLRTYTACTALSLLKLVLHTWIGAGIHNLSEEWHRPQRPPPPSGYPPAPPPMENDDDRPWWRPWHHHRPPFPPPPPYHHGGHGPHSEWSYDDQRRHDVRFYSTIVGVALCVGLFFYLTHLSRKALARAQAEQDERDAEEGAGLLRQSMAEEE